MNNGNITLLVLAAGESRRMGRPKQLLQIGNETLISYQLRKWKSCKVQNIVVVLGAQSKQILPELIDVKSVVNQIWKNGMGSSIKKGVQFILSEYPKTESILIVLVDQIEISSDHLNEMILTYLKNQESILAAYFNNQHGAPVIYPKMFFNQLLTIDDQNGAKSILKKEADQIIDFYLPEAAFDLDTPQDYEKFLQRSRVTE